MSESNGYEQCTQPGPFRFHTRSRSRLICAATIALGVCCLLLAPARAEAGVEAGVEAVAPHTATANPTCASATGLRGDQLTGCVQATPSGVTFTWNGYADYSNAVQYVQVNGAGTAISQQVFCTLPDCALSFPLAPGEYSGRATLVTGAGPGEQTQFDLVVNASDPPLPPAISAPIVGVAATPDGLGYWEAGRDGNVYALGDAMNDGTLSGTQLNKPIVSIAATPDGNGYWLLGADGGVFSFGDAQFYGSTGGLVLNQPVVGIASTPDGQGYWLVASDGGVFTFGDAHFYGSTGNLTLQKPVVGLAVDRATGGYWLVASDGGIFSFNAPFYGSTGNVALAAPMVGMEAATDGSGYRLAARDGSVFDFNQPFAGSLGGHALPAPIVGMASNGSDGYWVIGAAATVTGFGGARTYGYGS
jgi:hypothetical protein